MLLGIILIVQSSQEGLSNIFDYSKTAKNNLTVKVVPAIVLTTQRLYAAIFTILWHQGAF